MMDQAELAQRFQVMGDALAARGHRVVAAEARSRLESGEVESSIHFLEEARNQLHEEVIAPVIAGLREFFGRGESAAALTRDPHWKAAVAKDSQVAEKIAQLTEGCDFQALLTCAQQLSAPESAAAAKPVEQKQVPAAVEVQPQMPGQKSFESPVAAIQQPDLQAESRSDTQAQPDQKAELAGTVAPTLGDMLNEELPPVAEKASAPAPAVAPLRVETPSFDAPTFIPVAPKMIEKGGKNSQKKLVVVGAIGLGLIAIGLICLFAL